MKQLQKSFFLLLFISSSINNLWAQDLEVLMDSINTKSVVDSLPKPSEKLFDRIYEIINSSDCICPGIALFILTIEADGTVSEARLIRNAKGDWDENLLRFLSTSKDWIPAFKNGKAIRMEFSYPLRIGTPLTPECCDTKK